MTASTVSMDSARQVTEGPARWLTPETLFWTAVLTSHLPMLPIHFRRLWVYEHYHYVPFVLAAFGYFIWQRWPTGSTGLGLPKTVAAVLSGSLLLLAIATMAWSPWLAAVATILTIGAVLVQFAGAPGVGRLIPAWLLLWFLIPIPMQLDVRLIFGLQTLASQQASYVLDSLGINHLLLGHTLETPGKQFLVEEACSGVQSIFGLLAFTAILMLALRRSWVHTALLLGLAVFWAAAMNVVRVTSVVVAFEWFQVDLGTHWRHEFLGLATNGFAILLIFCSDQVVMFFGERPQILDDWVFQDEPYFESSDSPTTESLDEGSGPRGARRPAELSRISIAIAFLFAILGISQLAVVGFSSDSWKVTGEASQRLQGAFQAHTLPDELGPWKQTEFDNKARAITDYQGAQSSVWTYRSADTTVLVHINYPFLGWHNLPSCFQGRGWNPVQMELANCGPQELEVWQMKVVQSPNEMQVLFCQFDRYGQPVQPITGWRSASWSTILRQGVRQLPIRGSDTASYQVVMQVTTEGGKPQWSTEQLVEQFVKIRHQLAATIAERLGND